MSPSSLSEHPTTHSSRVPKSKYRLDTDSSSILVLPDGRHLGYAQYGSLTGRAIFHLHGIPGSRLEGAFFDEEGLKHDARIITIDRPGLGWSSPHPGWSLLSFTEDLVQLAAHLGLEKYGVMVRPAALSKQNCKVN